jgi:hypothetical protein
MYSLVWKDYLLGWKFANAYLYLVGDMESFTTFPILEKIPFESPTKM